jgi:hypothetical protein
MMKHKPQYMARGKTPDELEETRILKVTVKGNKIERGQVFKMIDSILDTSVTEVNG